MRLRKEQSLDNALWVEFHLDPVTGQKVEVPDDPRELTEDVKYDTIKIRLRFLRVKEMNEMQNEVYSINAELKSKRVSSVSSNFNYGLFMEKKMETAIIEWDNVLDEEGEVAPINIEYIELLPGWVGESLIEKIDEMNDMGTEILGE